MKSNLIILFTFTFLGLSICNLDGMGKTREFLKGFLGTIRGKDFHLDDSCLAGEFNEMLEKTLISFIERKYDQVLQFLYELLKLEKDKCPTLEMGILLEDWKKAMRSGIAFTNLVKYSDDIKDDIEDFMSSNLSSTDFGILMGTITKIAVYGTDTTTWMKGDTTLN